MGFRQAVESTKALKGAYKPGLQVLKRNSNRISYCASCKISGSIDMDNGLKKALPNAERWDYGVGFKLTGSAEKVAWIGVHPAASNHVDEVLAKQAWLKTWLKEHSTELSVLPCDYIWIASGSVHLPQTGPQERRLAKAGLRFPCSHYFLGKDP